MSGKALKVLRNLSADHPVASSKLGYKIWVREISEKQPESCVPAINLTKRDGFLLRTLDCYNDAQCVNVYDLAEEIFASESNLKTWFCKAYCKHAWKFGFNF